MLNIDELFAQLLSELRVRRNVDAMQLANFLMHKRKQEIIYVVSTQMGVAVSREHLVNVAFRGGNELEDGDVEGAAAEIVDRNVAALLFMQPISKRRRSRLVDQAQNFQTSELSGVFGRLALRIVEIGGHGNNRAIDAFAEIGFRPIFQFAQNERGNFRRREKLVAEANANDVFARRIDAERKQF